MNKKDKIIIVLVSVALISFCSVMVYQFLNADEIYNTKITKSDSYNSAFDNLKPELIITWCVTGPYGHCLICNDEILITTDCLFLDEYNNSIAKQFNLSCGHNLITSDWLIGYNITFWFEEYLIENNLPLNSLVDENIFYKWYRDKLNLEEGS